MIDERRTLLRTENLRLAGCPSLGVDLALLPGARVGILGAPGSGKTTLLRTLARLEPVREGRLFWGNVDVTRRPRWLMRGRRRAFVKMILANPYTSLAPWAWVERFMHGHRHSGDVQALLKHCGLTPVVTRQRIAALSGLQRVRLAFAYAMLDRPRVLMVDDVFGTLMPEVWDRALVALRAAVGDPCAVIVTSRYPRVVQALDDIYVLKHGVLVRESG